MNKAVSSPEGVFFNKFRTLQPVRHVPEYKEMHQIKLWIWIKLNKIIICAFGSDICYY